MGIFSRKKTIYYPGNTLTKYCPDLVLNWKTLLADFGIQAETVEDINSGWALWDQGYKELNEQHQKLLKSRFRREGVQKIITSSPEAAFMFRKFHPALEVQHTTEVVFEHLDKVQEFNTGVVTWHDNTTQVRRNNIVNQPRAILQQAGFVLKEYDENKTETQCLGTSTSLVNNSPRLAGKLVLRRAKLAPTKTIITDSPEDYLHFRRNTSTKVLELSEVLVEI